MKQIINRMELRFPSGSVNESFARGAVSAFVLCLDPLVTDLNDLKTAVSEAVTNAIVHGYRDTIGTVYITAVIYADGTVQVKVRDRGCGIPDIEKAMEPLFTTGGEERAAWLCRDAKLLRQRACHFKTSKRHHRDAHKTV